MNALDSSAVVAPLDGALARMQDAAIAYAEAVQLERKLTHNYQTVIRQFRAARALLTEQQAKARAARQVLDAATEAFGHADTVRQVQRAGAAA